MQRELNAALGEWDLLLSPAAPTTAYRIGEARPMCWLRVQAASTSCTILVHGLYSEPAVLCGHALLARLQLQLVNTETVTKSAISSATSCIAAWARCAMTR